jgi:hypothetical protein
MAKGNLRKLVQKVQKHKKEHGKSVKKIIRLEKSQREAELERKEKQRRRTVPFSRSNSILLIGEG